MSKKINDTPSLANQQYRLFHDIYVFLDVGDADALSQFDLTPSQFTLLMLLDPQQGQNLIRMAERMLVARSTITRLIDQMEALGYVRRVNDPDDRRAQRVELTEKGIQLRENAFELHERSLQRRFAVLSEDDQEQLQQLLKKLRDSLLTEIMKPHQSAAAD